MFYFLNVRKLDILRFKSMDHFENTHKIEIILEQRKCYLKVNLFLMTYLKVIF